MFILRRLVEAALRENGMSDNDCYICSLSSKMIVYKGQLTPAQVTSITANGSGNLVFVVVVFLLSGFAQ